MAARANTPPANGGAHCILAACRSAALRPPVEHHPGPTHLKEQSMLDVILLAVGLGFFVLSIIYAYGCERL
jgi:hypothetical protein